MNLIAFKSLGKRTMRLFVAFFIIAIGTEMMVQANIGMNPWGTFTLGLMKLTGMTYGTLTQIIGLVILMILMIFRILPGIATVMDMILIGLMVNILHSFALIPIFNNMFLQVMLCFSGLFIFCYGIYMYYSSGLGAGPRDLLVIKVMQRTDRKLADVKTSIEAFVFVIGVAIGGEYGIGTIIITLFTGKILEMIFRYKEFDLKTKEQEDLKTTFKTLFNHVT